MATYLVKKRLIERKDRFPVTLMLEPLEICNLECHGCGLSLIHISEPTRPTT